MQPQPPFDSADFDQALIEMRLDWKRHALERMLLRGITRADVVGILLSGDLIESYPHDVPFPSALFLGFSHLRPLHVVAAFDEAERVIAIITVYEPDAEHFEADLKTRRV